LPIPAQQGRSGDAGDVLTDGAGLPDVPGDAQATADSVLGSRWLFASSLVTWLAIVAVDVAISVTFYLLLRPVSHAVSLLAAALRLVYSAVLAAVLLTLLSSASSA
jgi:hypothetical protein